MAAASAASPVSELFDNGSIISNPSKDPAKACRSSEPLVASRLSIPQRRGEGFRKFSAQGRQGVSYRTFQQCFHQNRDRFMYHERVRLQGIIATMERRPFYLYSKQGLDSIIGYAVQANNNLKILQHLRSPGSRAVLGSGNELRVALNAGSDPSRSLAALHQRRLPCADGFKEDARHMFDKTPLRDSTPNKDMVSVSAQTTSAAKGFGNQQRKKSSDPFQILIVLISGKSMLHWVRSSDLVQDIKLLLEKKTGIPAFYLRLLCAGKQLEDTCPLSCYNIQRNDSITLSMRLRGGTVGQSSSAAAFSYKDAVHSQKAKERAPPTQAPKPFIVDKSDDIPSIELAHPLLDEHHQVYAERGIICRFNGLWPNTADLYQWIHANWTNNCKVFFCSKGFFITVFVDSDDYQKVLTKGPWFWNSAGLFLTPWFPEFDPSTAVITKLPIWVRLPNLLAHLWSYVVFEAIGNSLGRFLETDTSRGSKGLYTYARICAEIDISKGLPDQIILKIGDFHWSQPLDFENTAFRCRNCHLTGHLQSSCPTLPFQKKKAKAKPKSKSWKLHDPPPVHVVSRSDDEVVSSSDDEDVEEDVEVVEEMSEQVSPTVRLEEASVPPSSQKRTHESSPSESDKELSSPVQHSLQIVLKHQDPNGWVKVGKKKGKKSRPSDSTLSG